MIFISTANRAEKSRHENLENQLSYSTKLQLVMHVLSNEWRVKSDGKNRRDALTRVVKRTIITSLQLLICDSGCCKRYLCDTDDVMITDPHNCINIQQE